MTIELQNEQLVTREITHNSHNVLYSEPNENIIPNDL